MNMQTVQYLGPAQQATPPPPFRYNGPTMQQYAAPQQHVAATLPHGHQPHHQQQQSPWFVSSNASNVGGAAAVVGVGHEIAAAAGVGNGGGVGISTATTAGFMPNTNPIYSTTPIKGNVSELNSCFSFIPHSPFSFILSPLPLSSPSFCYCEQVQQQNKINYLFNT